MKLLLEEYPLINKPWFSLIRGCKKKNFLLTKMTLFHNFYSNAISRFMVSTSSTVYSWYLTSRLTALDRPSSMDRSPGPDGRCCATLRRTVLPDDPVGYLVGGPRSRAQDISG